MCKSPDLKDGYDMFHGMVFVYRAPKMEHCPYSNSLLIKRKSPPSTNDMFHDMFTICLFISPDLDGHRAPKNRALTLFHDRVCFTICLFISPDLDGHRAPGHDMARKRGTDA